MPGIEKQTSTLIPHPDQRTHNLIRHIDVLATVLAIRRHRRDVFQNRVLGTVKVDGGEGGADEGGVTQTFEGFVALGVGVGEALTGGTGDDEFDFAWAGEGAGAVGYDVVEEVVY